MHVAIAFFHFAVCDGSTATTGTTASTGTTDTTDSTDSTDSTGITGTTDSIGGGSNSAATDVTTPVMVASGIILALAALF